MNWIKNWEYWSIFLFYFFSLGFSEKNADAGTPLGVEDSLVEQ